VATSRHDRAVTAIRAAARDTLPRFATGPVGAVVGVLAVLLTALSGRYGYHRDELYFLVAGRHLDWGYVDQPPLTPLLARVSTAIFGESPAGLRVVATLLGVGVVVVCALIARELGGGRGTQVVAALLAAASGFTLGASHMVSTATTDLLVWLVVIWLLLRLLRTGDGRWFVPMGAAIGVGLLNKYLVVLLVVSLLAAVLLVGPRQVLRSWWLLAGAAVGLAVAAPNLVWQAAHGWPQLTVASGISAEDGLDNRLQFVPLQLLQVSPLFVPVWVAGLVRLWRDPSVRWARSVGAAYLVACGISLLVGGKSYYAMPLLIALLVVGVEPVLGWVRPVRWRRWAAAGVVAVAVLVNAVVTLPVLPAAQLSVVNAMYKEQGEQVAWPEFVAAVADQWEQIPAGERGHAVIYTQNYGEAGAIDRYRDRYDLPRPYSGHMSYADWGRPPDSADGPVLLVRFPYNQGIREHFTGCREVARFHNPYGLDNDEQGVLIERCRTSEPWSTLWPQLRHYY